MVIVSKQLKVPSTGKQLSDYAEGDIVKIKENGTPVEFYVAKHNYQTRLNGAGRTLLVRKECYKNMRWASSWAQWSRCEIIDWLVNDYKNFLDTMIQDKIAKTTFLVVRQPNENYTTEISEPIFFLALKELGFDAYNDPYATGPVLPISNILASIDQWTRTPVENSSASGNSAFYINSSGNDDTDRVYNEHGVRPVFTLPQTIMVNAANVIE